MYKYILAGLVLVLSVAAQTIVTDKDGHNYYLVKLGDTNHVSVYTDTNYQSLYIKSLRSEVITNTPIEMIRIPLPAEIDNN